MGCIVLDVIGIGLGPFNLSLAALLVQANESKKAVTSNITSLFFEKNSDFNWHEGMLLPKTTLQVPFFADLVTLVAPHSPRHSWIFRHFLHDYQKPHWVIDEQPIGNNHCIPDEGF